MSAGQDAPAQPEMLSIGALREAIIEAMDLGGAWGSNMHESKEVLVRLDGKCYRAAGASTGVHPGALRLRADGRGARPAAVRP